MISFLFAAALFATPSAARADSVRLMSTGELGLAQIHRDLTRARRSVDISTFIWEPCERVGKLVVDDLVAARRRGVRVRILVDAWTQKPEVRRNLSRYFAGLGFELRYFNVRLAIDPMNNRRLHAKMIVVDGKRYYLGGRNVADDYFDLGTNNWVDRDVAVEGRSARAAAAQFEMLWSDPMTSSEDLGPTEEFAAWSSTCFARAPEDRRLKDVLEKKTGALFAASELHRCRDVKVFTDEPGFADVPGQLYSPTNPLGPEQYARKHTTRAVVDFVAAVGRRLDIENYTYVPEGLLDDALAYQRDRGVVIKVFTNFNMDTGPIHYLKEQAVAKDGVGSQTIEQISNRGSLAYRWELTPTGEGVRWNIHTKAMAADRSGLVGSFNIDPRSYLANLESTVVVTECASFANDLRASIARLEVTYRRDATCAPCHEKVEVSAADRLQAELARRLYFVKPKRQ